MFAAKAIVAVSVLATTVLGFPSTPSKAKLVTRQTILDSYDYVIVGGGTSGLTVADRLTEDSSKTVLVIESGPLDNREDVFLVPRYFMSAPPAWWYNLTSVPQRGISNRTFGLQAGRLVGGGSAMNGMFFDRGSAGDYDLWKELGNPGWGWDGLLPYFKKSETFHPPDAATVEEYRVTYDLAFHGTDGPIHMSYPPYLYPAVRYFQDAWKEFGSHISKDGHSGDALGAFWIPNPLDPSKMVRSYARTEHFDRVASRTNLHLLVGNTVTKVLFEGTAASGVEFAPNANSMRTKVTAKREVILAAGAPHTPQILQLSGVGPAALLQSFNIPVVADLPGVGGNFQDHPVIGTSGTLSKDLNPSPRNASNAAWMAEQLILYQKEKKGIYTTAAGNSAAFLPLHEISNRTDEIVAAYQAQDPATLFPAGTDATILAGWNAQRNALLASIRKGTVAVAEFAGGTSGGMPIVLEKPLSRGSINIKSIDPFADPIVDFGVFTNPVDADILVESIKAWRILVTMPSFQALGAVATNPPNTLRTNDELRGYVTLQAGPTIAHPSSTASMLPKNFGGVVSPELLVYGVTKLSVVDASIIPMTPATHICTTVYAIAEKAADLIKARNL